MDSSSEKEWKSCLCNVWDPEPSHLTVAVFKKIACGGGESEMPPQWGSIETITTNVRQEPFPLCTRFYNFVNEVWIEPTHLSGKLTMARLAAWFNIYNYWSEIVFALAHQALWWMAPLKMGKH